MSLRSEAGSEVKLNQTEALLAVSCMAFCMSKSLRSFVFLCQQ